MSWFDYGLNLLQKHQVEPREVALEVETDDDDIAEHFPALRLLTEKTIKQSGCVGHAEPVGLSQVIARTGTLGCLVDTPGGLCILSNNHVLAVSNTASRGDHIFQPSPSDGASSGTATRIATLTDFEPLRFGSAVNRIDAAIAALDDVDSVIPDIMTIGPPANPPVAPFLGQSVVKHGRTTSLTFGSVVDTSFDGNVHYDGAVAYFEDQIVVAGDAGPFSKPGDSGSLILGPLATHIDPSSRLRAPFPPCCPAPNCAQTNRRADQALRFAVAVLAARNPETGCLATRG